MTSVAEVPVDPAAARALSQAAQKARHWTAERDRLIVQAVKAGGSLREVAETVGLSHSAIDKIVRRNQK